MLRRSLVLGMAAAPFAALAFTSATTDLSSIERGLAFDDIFPRKSFFGRSASDLAWSHDSRYLLYTWNPYNTPYSDLWLYDSKSKEAKRLTSIEMMARYDRDIPAAIEQYKKDREEEEELLGMDEMEYREELQERVKERRERKEPPKRYPGISEASWHEDKQEFLMVFDGDIFRWKLGDKNPERLTRTQARESSARYSKDGKSYTYRRDSGVYRAWFGASKLVQLNPPLPSGLNANRYEISPDEKHLFIQASKSTGQNRQVDYITYRSRFAQARTTNRGVADDSFKQETRLFLYDLNDNPEVNPKHDGKPWEIWKWEGGKEYQEISLSSEPWSPDGRSFVFGWWHRGDQELKIQQADTRIKRVRTIYKTDHDGEHRSPSLSRPFYTADGKHVILLLENSGWRQAWAIDPPKRSAMQITDGDFELFPIEALKDGGFLARASKEHLSQMDIYRVNMEGEMTRLTSRDGMYGNPEVSPDQKKMAMIYNSWTDLRELNIVSTEGETQVTKSHKDGWFDRIKVEPNLFTYQNRHGDSIHGFKFLPKDMKPGERRPLFIYVYGGPLGTGKSVVNGTFSSTGFMFLQYLTHTLGYITATIDPRGQSGYGAEFGKANYEQIGEPQTEDLMDLVAYMDREHGVDRERVGLTGWSFGGFQTQHAMYTAPNIFTLGIAGAGPTEWQNYNTWYSGGVVGPSPNSKPEDLDVYSLTHKAKNLESPLMLLHGMEDTNVLFQDTIAVYRKLLQYGKGHLVELALDPTGGHGLGGDISTRDRHRIYLEFILKHWGVPDRN